ncbi:hypothetical protein TNCT_541341 [Trichonephila clavata]|uniref:Uncharacterized protein n=1 Tax=Trichonephila clavata TaxID=2740835 RepID=A0A8X6HWR5_TRICU|nr:hypothetical protein TNCT_541341 [Trichonephila clavata]
MENPSPCNPPPRMQSALCHSSDKLADHMRQSSFPSNNVHIRALKANLRGESYYKGDLSPFKVHSLMQRGNLWKLIWRSYVCKNSIKPRPQLISYRCNICNLAITIIL